MAMPTETRPTLKMKTSHDPATRTSPDAEREKTPLLAGAGTAPDGAALVDDMTSPLKRWTRVAVNPSLVRMSSLRSPWESDIVA
jgi:hypothetical protein